MPGDCVSEQGGSSLALVMAWRLFGAKPLPDPISTCYQLGDEEHTPVKFLKSKYKSFFHKMHARMSSAKYRPFCSGHIVLTHWGRVTHMCVSKITSIGSDYCLSPGWHQAIFWTNARIFFIWPLGTNFSEVFIEIHKFSFKKMHLKMSSAKYRPFCLGLNMLSPCYTRLTLRNNLITHI